MNLACSIEFYIWTILCKKKLKWRHNDILNSNTYLPWAYLNDIPNFILIGHERSEIQSRKLINNYEEIIETNKTRSIQRTQTPPRL